MPTTKIIAVDTLQKQLLRLFEAEGLNQEHAQQMTSGLLETSLKGIDTHGLRLLPLYIRELREGRAVVNPEMKIDKKTVSMASMDAGGALGIVAGYKAVQTCIDMSRESGFGLISVSNSNHFGAASVYGDQVAQAGMIGMVSSNAAPRVVPFNGLEKLFGTDPWCFTSPISKTDVFSLDMATSQVAYAKVKEKLRKQEALPAGWCKGVANIAPTHFSEVAGLLPLGGHKGQGLSMMVQILSGLLANSLLDHELQHLDEEPFNQSRNISHFMLAIDIQRFLELDTFHARMQEWIATIKGSQKAGSETIKIAGEVEQETRKKRLKSGIPFTDVEWRDITALFDTTDTELVSEIS